MAANALIDETMPADRADLHAGVVISLSADKLTDGTHRASRLASARMCQPANLTRTRQRFACRLIASSARDAWSGLSM
jgi:hypothetical protein